MVAACGDNTASSETARQLTPCNEPRPEACTFEYNPVCGLSGEEWKTYGNACSACADENVSGYRPGECEGGS